MDLASTKSNDHCSLSTHYVPSTKGKSTLPALPPLVTLSLSAHMRAGNCTTTQVQSKGRTSSKYMHCPSVEFPSSGKSTPAEWGYGKRKHMPSTSHAQASAETLVSCE